MKWLVSVCLALAACAHGAKTAPNRVLEQDLGDYVYRRFQKVEDIEVEVPGNAGVGYTAVYQRKATVGQAVVPRSAMAVAFVTEYERAGLAQILPEKLARLDGYRLRKQKVKGHKVLLLSGQDGDRWAFWSSRKYVVKIGGPEIAEVPDDVLRAYLDLYPSDLN